MTLDLTNGICETEQYKAWKFPGGEVHLKINKEFIDKCNIQYYDNILIECRLNTSDDIIFLLLVVDTLKKELSNKIDLFIPYMPYQQADRDFGVGECFSLKTICNLINSMNLNKVTLFDPHSDVSSGILNNCIVVDNRRFIHEVITQIGRKDLVIISPDSGAYKKIYKLCEKLKFTGDIITCSKSRDHETGEITTVVPKFDINKTVLIVDDIALGSRTFLNIRKEIPNKNVFLAVSHGIFNDNVDKLEKQFSKIYTTNSRRDESVGENIQVIKIF